MKTINDGTRTLFESTMMPEVIAALKDWIKASGGGVLIGGAALSYHIRPRMTQDIDVLFLHDNDIPKNVKGFKRIRPHAFQHNITHVEVEVVTSELIHIPDETINNVIKTSIPSDGIAVASASGLVSLKLGRLSAQDKADIIALIKTKKVDLSGFGLSQKELTAYASLMVEAGNDPHP